MNHRSIKRMVRERRSSQAKPHHHQIHQIRHTGRHVSHKAVDTNRKGEAQ
jgi:hypothetical protein